MVHTVRAQVFCMSVAVVVAVIASNLTWLYVTRGTEICRQGINGSFSPDCLYTKAYYLLKVKSYEDSRLTWEEEWQGRNLLLDSNKTWIIVQEPGFYLLYMQVTYGLKSSGNDTLVDLKVTVDYRFEQGEQEFAAAFDTRRLMEKEQDAHLGSFLLLRMNAGAQLSVRVGPIDRIKYRDIRPFSTYLTMVKYADL